MPREANYIDVHCHPQGKAFHFLRNSKHYNGKRYHPWTIILSNFSHQKKGKRAFSYAQCDLLKLWNGQGALVFASLYPFERGFFSGGGRVDKEGVNKILNFLDKVPLAGAVFGLAFRRLVRPIVSSEDGVISAKDHFQSLLMRMPMSRVNFIQSSGYDYYEELLEEYRFLTLRNEVSTKPELFGNFFRRVGWTFSLRKKARADSTSINEEVVEDGNANDEVKDGIEKGEGVYVIARNYDEAQVALQQKKLVLIITIEGMHALGVDRNPGEIFKRIEAIKKWEYPVFFVTFAHHFNNLLCGHAHSMPKEATLFVDQRDGMQAPFNDMGRAAIRFLLSITDTNVKNTAGLGRRILIDVKHMGATSRKEFYNDIVRPCFDQGDVIPVIASHVGYSGVKTITELEKHFEEGKETDEFQVVPGLNPWNINACDEDIEWIVRTHGLLGLCLDQRIMGLRKKEETKSDVLAWTNVKGILDAAIESKNLADAERGRIWDVLCLGTDFEGYIDPADEYPTALQFVNFEKDLGDHIQKDLIDKGLQGKYFITKSAKELAENICRHNVRAFLRNNFTAPKPPVAPQPTP